MRVIEADVSGDDPRRLQCPGQRAGVDGVESTARERPPGRLRLGASRAVETARIIAEHVGLGDPDRLPAVAERNYGEAEGLTGAQILARWPEGTPVPGRESRDEVVARALPALRDLGEQHPGENVIVVSHGGVISSLVRHVTDHALPAPGELIPNGSVHRFVYDDGELTLDRFNLGPEDRDLFTASVM
jgi:uncharacterized phosphatase